MQKNKLLLYYSQGCRYCQKVLKALEKINQTIPMINIDESDEVYNKLHALTGRYTVPVLMIDDKPMYESDDIVKWLEKYFA